MGAGWGRVGGGVGGGLERSVALGIGVWSSSDSVCDGGQEEHGLKRLLIQHWWLQSTLHPRPDCLQAHRSKAHPCTPQGASSGHRMTLPSLDHRLAPIRAPAGSSRRAAARTSIGAAIRSRRSKTRWARTSWWRSPAGPSPWLHSAAGPSCEGRAEGGPRQSGQGSGEGISVHTASRAESSVVRRSYPSPLLGSTNTSATA